VAIKLKVVQDPENQQYYLDYEVGKGIYHKFKVTRTDGSSRKGGKHADCKYFVLDLKHDPFCRPALAAYARACRSTHPSLADDLEKSLKWIPPRPCGCREAHCPHAFTFDPPIDIEAGRK